MPRSQCGTLSNFGGTAASRLCKNSNACRARRNIVQKLRNMRTDDAADIRFYAASENCIFYNSPMYEFSHSLDPKRRYRTSSQSWSSRAGRNACRNDIGAGANKYRQHIAVGGVERESSGGRPHQSANCCAGEKDANDAADIPPPKIIHDNGGKNGDPTAVEHAIDKSKGGERPDTCRERPIGERQCHADVRQNQTRTPSQAIGQTAKKEAAGRAADTNHGQK